MNIFSVMLKFAGVKYAGAVILFSLSIFSVNAIEPIVDEDISIVDAWVRLPPPVAKNSAAYFSIINQTDKDVTIVDVATTSAEITTMHNTVIKQGMSKMIHLKTLLVPAKSQIDFLPNGKHLMLLNLTEKLSRDKAILVTFSLANGKKITTQMRVGEPAGLRSSGEIKMNHNTKDHQHDHH